MNAYLTPFPFGGFSRKPNYRPRTNYDVKVLFSQVCVCQQGGYPSLWSDVPSPASGSMSFLGVPPRPVTGPVQNSFPGLAWGVLQSLVPGSFSSLLSQVLFRGGGHPSFCSKVLFPGKGYPSVWSQVIFQGKGVP